MSFNRFLVTVASLAILTSSSAVYAGDDTSKREIVVTGVSLKDTEADLKACIARTCPPDEEIRAALAHAENQFITGEYRDAKTTLYRTVGRNRKYGEDYPIEVSDLFRARGRVAEHLGDANDFRLAVLDMRDLLQENLPKDDARSMVAQIEVGESRLKLGYPKEAIRIFRDVTEKADAAGHDRVAAYASLRRLLIEFERADGVEAEGGKRLAIQGLRALAENPRPGAQDFALVAEVTLARLDRREGRQDSTAAIVKRYAENGGANRPILLSAEPVDMPDQRSIKGGTENTGIQMIAGPTSNRGYGGNALRMVPTTFDNRWIDMGFWVNPNGLVSEVEILRGSGDVFWARPVSDAIKSRIYAPLSTKGREAAPGFYMIERYSYTSHYLDRDATTGTRIQTRSPIARIERLDITPENYDQPFTQPAVKAHSANTE